MKIRKNKFKKETNKSNFNLIYYNKVITQQCNIFDIITCSIEDFMSGSLQPLFNFY